MKEVLGFYLSETERKLHCLVDNLKVEFWRSSTRV